MSNISATENGTEFTINSNGTIMEQAFRVYLQNAPTNIIIRKLTQDELDNFLRTKTLPDRMAEIDRILTSIKRVFYRCFPFFLFILFIVFQNFIFYYYLILNL